MQRDDEELILLLLREGSRSQAIRLYQEQTGANAEEAHEAIGSVAARHGLGHHRLKLTLVLMLLVVLAIGGVVAAMAG